MLDVRADSAWVEGSIPKAVRGVNYPSASPAEAVEVTRSWLREASQFVTWSEPARVNRVDVVRDFQVGHSVLGPSEVISSMQVVPTTLRATKAHYRDATEHQAQTMYVRTKRSGGGRLYDKGRESGLAAAEGIVRFEAQERKSSLRANGLMLVDHLETADLVSMGRRRFEWCGFHRPFSPAAALISRVWEDPEMTEGTKLQLTGFYSLASLGLGVALERTRHYRLRRLAEQFGYPSSVAWRLDWEEGVLADAA